MTHSVLPRILALVLPALLASCSSPAYKERGYASYVADHYAGHHTSSGEVYYPQGWTAAHNTLPFGAVVKVKNHANGRTVNVTVNDRFPYYPNRIINLSRAAAEYIQIPYHQMAEVTVTSKTAAQGTAPAASYHSPAPSGYGAAPANYGAPPPGYGAPPAGYGTTPAPATNYGAPPAGYGTTAAPSGLPPPPPGYPQR